MQQASAHLEKTTGFKPLHSDEFHCLLGYRGTANASELRDEALLRQSALLGVLDALVGTANLNELCSESLHGCILALHILCRDTSALHAASYEALGH